MRGLIPHGNRAIRTFVGRFFLCAAASAMALACGSGLPLSPSDAHASGTPEDRAFCAAQINGYRRSIGLPALQQSEALEAFASAAAERDGRAHIAHHHFALTNGGGVAQAETEILWWPSLSVRTVIQKGLTQMWEVGPSGEHYHILSGPYTDVGCGVFVNNGETTVTQDFR